MLKSLREALVDAPPLLRGALYVLLSTVGAAVVVAAFPLVLLCFATWHLGKANRMPDGSECILALLFLAAWFCAAMAIATLPHTTREHVRPTEVAHQ